ncbi:hypothetical protein C731_4432 [Mycolicibacterium hassiacum DSM 44199]|uniref:Uncharacterized protein n=1 Tax=Mycolicibacterium hassiacum (strain DSM 44199 / CIP 105218 / JCM 12690 / 3849) TaxID=1122247 RepID=K5BIL3_MYCHD|nr:hypothetical protein [Mycolicibacterium hassiacum]EKF21564.1 hypothetical protein C731_4432 [Mycolicibacterium hassiacum DSM 44199]MDA4084997.1 luciferase [Mycolicibacterium hassiacum DSM 44199]VCT89088.1 hypothetical protein MHAS_00774 [Mycolicibacterium hassiacum DSM 44199]
MFTLSHAYAIFSEYEAVESIRSGRPLPPHPLCGGIPPEITRPYLRRVADAGQLAEAG